MKFALLAVLFWGFFGKPTVSLEESCQRADAILSVELADKTRTLKVIDDLWGGKDVGVQQDAIIAVDLKSMVYEKGNKYILFLEQVGETKTLQAVPQMRTDDTKTARDEVTVTLRKLKKIQ